ncbi:Monosaccharide-sensing protein 1 [Stylosanthes scabra]|uniref:Monosaccharide-sensing protein 1 n=1 Tax=Stylosanthes scabra TaxID=79078 RepID=A0ABU6YC69_9FABA|nr:Monosaccharide-sensing protein 1 [Stylosanthes scabra]
MAAKLKTEQLRQTLIYSVNRYARPPLRRSLEIRATLKILVEAEVFLLSPSTLNPEELIREALGRPNSSTSAPEQELFKMGAILVAIAASMDSFLQGWDNATIAGAIVYLKTDLALQTSEEGLVVAMSLIGATLITTCSGAISDWLGRRPMLIISSVFYFLSALVMFWSPNVYVLCIARLLDGFGIGLAVTLVPVYISETSPSDIRGSLNTLL